MQMKTLVELFEVVYGNKLDLNKMHRARGGVRFVGRSSRNHGVTAVVARIPGVTPFESGLITVALGGSKLLSSFVQEIPFYTAQNVAVLKPRLEMSFGEKLFMCLCIRHNRSRYSAFGREANRSLKDLLVPEPSEFPAWTRDAVAIESLSAPKTEKFFPPTMDTRDWRYFELQELFDLRKGKRLTKANMSPGKTPFIGAIDKNNGLSAFVSQNPIHSGNTITVSYNGSIGEVFYQSEPFWCSDDVNVLYPKFKLTPAIAMFIATIIRRERFRYSYGRKWDLERMRPSTIRLPVTGSSVPDWQFMEGYVNALPFSRQL
jgi:Type I restriction modification DNA specificity domain